MTAYKPVKEITFGFSDAENYRRRENKKLFNKIFLRTEAIEKLSERNIFFLVGEKGTGKTAYAVYYSNFPTNETFSSHKFIRETDYIKFITLKNKFDLQLSEYVDIWKVILLLIISAELAEKSGLSQQLLQYPKFSNLKAAIDSYYSKAFSPEILSALQFVENSDDAVQLVAEFGGQSATAKLSSGQKASRDVKVFQTNLLYLQRQMEDALSSLKIPKNFMLFIDGIDIRPSNVPYQEYLDCVKGLANAIWSLNNDFFPSIRDSRGRTKCVMLVRPDIFNSLGLQNRNTKLKDNSLVLSWITDYGLHRDSELFLLADRLFSAQQDNPCTPGECWDHYFPFYAGSLDYTKERKTSFIVFLRYSYHRPRDILTMLDILREGFKGSVDDVFQYKDMFTSRFKEMYGNYLLGEIKDSLSFYYDESEFEIFLKFFEYLYGKHKFTFEEYLEAFQNFSEYLSSIDHTAQDFMRTPEEFLQFLYDQNILCFIEPTADETFIRWCFRERSTTNISPKVKLGMSYEIHYGLANTLNTGKPFTKKSIAGMSKRHREMDASRAVGRIKLFNAEKGYGFITQDNMPLDIFFHQADFLDTVPPKKGDLVDYIVEKSNRREGGLVAKQVSRSK